MNLGSILNGVLGLIMGQPWNGPQDTYDEDVYTNLGGMLDEGLAGFTGYRLTSAEREANAFTAQQSELAFNRSLMADSTKYQRAVADMQAAGINPMMAAGSSGGSSVSVPGASSVSPSVGNLGSLLSFILGKQQLAMQRKVAASEVAVNNAQADKLDADAEKTKEDTRGSKLSNDFFELMQEVRVESERLGNELKTAEKRSIYKNIDKADSEIVLAIEQAKSEQEKRNLMVSQEILNNTSAENIVKMRPYLQMELSARSENERSAAYASTIEAAYKQGMIDEGAIRAAVRASNASASKDEVESHVKAFSQMLSDGSLRQNAWSAGDWRSAVVFGLYQGISNAAKSILGKW